MHNILFNFKINFLASGDEGNILVELWNYFIDKYLTPEFRVYEHINVDYKSGLTPAMIFFAVFIAVMLGGISVIFTKRYLGRLVRRLMSADAYSAESAKTLKELGLNKYRILKLYINRYTLSKSVRCREEDEFYGVKYVPKEHEMYPEKKISTQKNEKDILIYDEIESSSTSNITSNAKIEPDNANKEISSTNKETDSTNAELNGTNKEISSTSEGDFESSEDEKPGAYEISQVAKVKYKRKADIDHFYVLSEQKYRLRLRFDAKGTNPMMLIVLAVSYIALGLLIIHFLPSILQFADNFIGIIKGE